MHETEHDARAATTADTLDASQIEAPMGGRTSSTASNGAPLDRATFFQRAAQRRIRVALPELGEGVHVYVRGLTAGEAQGGLEQTAKKFGLDPNDSALTVATCTVGENGAPMFVVPDDLDALRSLDVAVFSAIYKAIVRQSGVTQADVEAASKN